MSHTESHQPGTPINPTLHSKNSYTEVLPTELQTRKRRAEDKLFVVSFVYKPRTRPNCRLKPPTVSEKRRNRRKRIAKQKPPLTHPSERINCLQPSQNSLEAQKLKFFILFPRKQKFKQAKNRLEAATRGFVPSIHDTQSSSGGVVFGEENVQVTLQNRDMWTAFSKIGTEMIVTKAGRRMFPGLKVKCSGLSPIEKYAITVDVVPVDNYRYKFHDGEWLVSGNGSPCTQNRVYVHPDSPATGISWMQKEISFHKLKLTNNQNDRNGHVIVNAMQKYQPRIRIMRCRDMKVSNWEEVKTVLFEETQIFAVKAYQNQEMTKMKINNNPFARGFRDGQMASQRLAAGVKRRARECNENGLIEQDLYPRTKKAKYKPNSAFSFYPNDGTDLYSFPTYQTEFDLFTQQNTPDLTPCVDTRKAEVKSRRSASDLLPSYCQDVLSRTPNQISHHTENSRFMTPDIQRRQPLYPPTPDTCGTPVMRTPELYRTDCSGVNIHKSDHHIQYANYRYEATTHQSCFELPTRPSCCQTVSPDYRLSASSSPTCQYSPNFPSPYSLLPESCGHVQQTFTKPCRYQMPPETFMSTPLYKRNDRILNGPDSFNNGKTETDASEFDCSLSPSPDVSDLSFPLFNFDHIGPGEFPYTKTKNSVDSPTSLSNEKAKSASRDSLETPPPYDTSDESNDQKVPLGSPDAPFEDLLSEAMFLTLSSIDNNELKIGDENEFLVEGFDAILK